MPAVQWNQSGVSVDDGVDARPYGRPSPVAGDVEAYPRGRACFRWPPAARSLRILEVCNDFPPTVGGSETHNTGEVAFLADRGHKVCVLAVRDIEAMVRNGIDDRTRSIIRRGRWHWSPEHKVPVYEAVDRNRASLLPLVSQYAKLSRRHGPFDVVVVHRAHFLPAFALARRLVLTLHYMELVCPKHTMAPLCSMGPDGRCDCFKERSSWQNAKWRLRRRLSTRLMSAVVTKYPHIAEKLRASGIPEAKIHHIPNWIDTSAYGGRRRVWPAMPADLPDWARAGSFLFVLLCRLTPEHGPRHAIDGFIRLARRVPGVRLLVIGDGPEAPILQRRVAEAFLADRVRFLGRVDHADVPAALSWGDCGLATSDMDNYGWRLLEMMAAGLPVIATDAGPMRDLIDDGMNGYLCAATPDGVAAAMECVLWGRGGCREMGANARARIEQAFSRDNLLKYEAVLLGEARV